MDREYTRPHTVKEVKNKQVVGWSMPLLEATPAAPQFATPTLAAAQQAWFGAPSREREGASNVGGGASDMAPLFASSVTMSTNLVCFMGRGDVRKAWLRTKDSFTCYVGGLIGRIAASVYDVSCNVSTKPRRHSRAHIAHLACTIARC